MKAWVGVTDWDWYRFLLDRPELTEVNFWLPSEQPFAVRAQGDAFYFKTKAARGNRIVGGGFVSEYLQMTLSDAWRLFGPRNGVAGLPDLQATIAAYRRERIEPGYNPRIGCVMVHDVVFFDENRTADPPPGLAPSLTRGRSYDLAKFPQYLPYFQDLLGRLVGAPALEVDLSTPWHADGDVRFALRLGRQRLGQQAFHAVVEDAYHRRCAITGDKILPTLEAAHIVPVTDGGQHRLDNGLLLRSDVHKLYDDGYLAIDAGHRLLVSPRLRREFGNGDRYYAMAGERIAVLPAQRHNRPNREFLEWHRDVKYRAT